MSKPAPSPTPGRGKRISLTAGVLTLLAAVFSHEGGFVDHRDDPGGPTRYGVTQEVAREHGFTGDMRTFPKHCTLPGDVSADLVLAPDQIEKPGDVCADLVLARDYIEKPGFMPLIEIDPTVAEEVVDTAVNMGPVRPSRWFQLSVNEVCGTRLTVDGRVGPASVGAWRTCRAAQGSRACVAMLEHMDAHQEAEYDRLVRRNPRLRAFRKGWQNLRIGNVDRARCTQAEA
ncbi:secretion activating protein [Novosphingobium sp. YJ-S2-02]|uniref:Secretion activating protein n=1 Tax=Novosphingobium aureum TaxID=2792964 RepID=A0A931HC61_9SPHN|nr:glycosyl hydrolase 108 family protein [Novosphingobium aureum]MBH0113251.1 secretion activating protein [Novosphingobium aureum]